MDLLQQFQQYIKNEQLFQPTDHLLLAVSGGVDSVVLCDLCKRSGFDFSIAHCNFQLRGAESDADELFVKELGKKYQVEVFSERFDTNEYAAKNKLGIQVAARELRYNWFQTLINPATKQAFKYLLTAHHANDNIETLLMHFFRGTGMAGLQGILPKTGSGQILIRPLLVAKKDALIEYAKENQLAYREDASNESNKYTRNFFRNELLPAIREVYPQVEDNLSDNTTRFHEIGIIYNNAINALKKKLIVEKKNEYHLPVLKLLKTPALQTVLFELMKEFDFAPGQTTDIIRLLHGESGKYVDSASHRILRNREWLIVSKLGAREDGHFLIEENDQQLRFSKFTLSVSRKNADAKIDSNTSVAELDASGIQFPLLVRKWKQGDYFYPLGMRKKKKLSRFFIDKKLSLNEKEQVWVVEMNKKIIWVAGQRIDDRFKITPNTKSVLRLVLSSSE